MGEGGFWEKRFSFPFIYIYFFCSDDAAMKDWVRGLEKDKEELSELL